VPHYANGLVKVVAIFGVINRVPATTPAHNVFCYSAVAHILTPSVNLAFVLYATPKYFDKLKPDVCRGQQGELKGYILHPPTVKID